MNHQTEARRKPMQIMLSGKGPERQKCRGGSPPRMLATFVFKK